MCSKALLHCIHACIINFLLGGVQNVGIKFDFVKDRDGAVSFYCVKGCVA